MAQNWGTERAREIRLGRWMSGEKGSLSAGKWRVVCDNIWRSSGGNQLHCSHTDLLQTVKTLMNRMGPSTAP